MQIKIYSSEMKPLLPPFFEKYFSNLGMSFSPSDRHSDILNVENEYMARGCFWCMFDGEKLIGTVALREIDSNKKYFELKRMFVLPEYQNKGYGRKLLQIAIDFAKQKQYNKIYLDTRKDLLAAQHLYKSFGFMPTEKYNDNQKADLYFVLEL